MDQWIWDIGYAVGGIILAALTASGHISKMKVYLKDAIDFLLESDKCLVQVEKTLETLYAALEDNKMDPEEVKSLITETKLTISQCKPMFERTGHYKEMAGKLNLSK